MKKLLFFIILLIVQSVTIHASNGIEPINLSPIDESQIGRPIKRAPIYVPSIGIDGHTLVRLQDATNQTYLVEIQQDGEVVYSTTWIFQTPNIMLLADLKGEYKIVLSSASIKYIGTLYIE